MRINNVSGLWAWNRLESVNRSMLNVMQQLSTGKRIPAARHDAAGLAIANKLRAQIEGFYKAFDNAAYGINLLNTAEGGMSTIQNALQRMRELAVQAANGTLTDAERAALQEEFNQLRQQIAQTANNTEYNTQKVLQGYTGQFQIGANEGQTMEVNIPAMNPENLQANTDTGTVNLNELDISTREGAANAINAIDQMVNQVSSARSNIGAYTNRLESAMRNIGNTIVNTTSSLSTIEDMDMAQGILQQTRLMLLRNFTTGVLAQTHLNMMNVMNLLG